MEPYASYQPTQSPLFMAMQDPVLHQFISYLSEKRTQQESNPGLPIRIELSRQFADRVRESFKQNILRGEVCLHIMSHVLGSRFLGENFELHSNVIGVLPGGEDRPFLIRERITRDILFSHTDLDLGNHLLGKFRYQSRSDWEPLNLSANFVEYIPASPPGSGVNRITSRVKAEEELWNKVADEIFSLDQLVSSDKHLRQYSKYIKDIFGIKLVCEDEKACLRVHQRLVEMQARDFEWSVVKKALRRGELPLPLDADGRLLEMLETKDYLTCDPSEMKKTGWKAIKSVARWQNQLLEIQVQPLTNYYLELDHMAGPSHHSFKLRRDRIRAEIAERIPLYGFYRALLRRMFVERGDSFDFENAAVRFID